MSLENEMPILEPRILSPREQYEEDWWITSECKEFYVQQRRRNCKYTQLMELCLSVPYCTSCALSDPFGGTRPPDIGPENWEEDLLWTVSEETLNRVIDQLVENPDLAFQCKGCGSFLQPWEGDDVYVFSQYLEENYTDKIES